MTTKVQCPSLNYHYHMPDVHLTINVTMHPSDADHKSCDWSAWLHHISGSSFFAAIVRTSPPTFALRFHVALNSGKLTLLYNICQLQLRHNRLHYAGKMVENSGGETQHRGM